MKHTNGPWESSGNLILKVARHSQQRIRIAEVITEGEDRANLNLISSAPEMLELLIELNNKYNPEQAGPAEEHQLGVKLENLLKKLGVDIK